MTDTPILEAREARLSYSTRRGPILAVDRADLRIGAGEFVAIIGPSGSGKSTLLALMGGLCRPDSGGTLINGRDWRTLTSAEANAARAAQVALLPQDGGLLPGLRALDNVLLPAVLAGASPGEARLRAMALLEQVGLAARWDAYPAELSGGQRRRVALARALAGGPKVILADEPTGDLDGPAAGEITAILAGIRAQGRTAVLVVTHDPTVSAMADRVVLVRGGRCTPAEKHEVVPFAGAGFEGHRTKTQDAFPGNRSGVAVFEPAPPGLVPAEPGSGIRDVLAGWLVFLAGVAATATAVGILDSSIAGGQRTVVREAKSQRKLAEEMALQDLRADVEDVTLAPDGRVTATLFLQNYRPERPLHVLGPTLEVGIQRNGRWEGLPLESPDDPGRIRRIAVGKEVVTVVFSIPAGRNDELLPGYMHMRIGAAMVVSDQPGGGDLFDRQDAYYLYLRDPRRTEDDVRRANSWGAKSTVPLWISMPSH